MRIVLLAILAAFWLGATPVQAETGLDRVAKRFMALDRDGDDAVSFSEFMEMVRARARERFAAMDQNGDGEVTEEEFRSFWRKRKAEWYRPRH